MGNKRIRIWRAEISSSVTGLHEFESPSIEWGVLESKFSDDAASVMFLKKSLNQSNANQVLSNGISSISVMAASIEGCILSDSKWMMDSFGGTLADGVALVVTISIEWRVSGEKVRLDVDCCSLTPSGVAEEARGFGYRVRGR